MEYQDITEKIIGCAFKVYNQMGYGYLESVYEKCMIIELGKSGLTVELKSVRKLNQAHEVQLVNYLVSTRKPVGLLLNFGGNEVEIRRKVLDLNEGSNQ